MEKIISRVFPFRGHTDLVESYETFFAILLVDNTICRRSILTQYALSYAANNINVLFVAPEKFSSLPIPIHGMLEPSPQIMQNIQFLYFTHFKEVIHFLSSIQKNGPLSLLIFDGLEQYYKQIQQEENDSERVFAKFLALLVDAGGYISGKREKILPIMASYSGTSDLSLFWKYFVYIWKVESILNDEKFLLNINEEDNLEWQIKFSQNNSTLILNNILKVV